MIDEGADAFLVRVPDAVRPVHELGLDDELTQPAVGRAKVVVRRIELKFLPERDGARRSARPDRAGGGGMLSAQGLAEASPR